MHSLSVLFSSSPRIIGCVCFVHDHSVNQTKLDPKAFKHVFLGYSQGQKGYRCYSPTLHKFVIFEDVTFFEFTPYFIKESSKSPSFATENDFMFFSNNSSAPNVDADLMPHSFWIEVNNTYQIHN